MKKLFFAVVMILFAVPVFVFAEVNWETKEIYGFNPEETAVKGLVQTELKKLAGEINVKLGGKNADILINVEGLADQTGAIAKNDRIGKERAENAAAYLSTFFPNAKFSAFTSGDSQNVRGVKVRWAIQWPVAPAEQPEGSFKKYRFAIIALLIVIGAGTFGILLVQRTKYKAPCITEPLAVETEAGCWPTDLDELAKIILDKKFAYDEKLCPYCKTKNRMVGIKWINLKSHLAKCSSLGEQRNELFEKIRHYA